MSACALHSENVMRRTAFCCVALVAACGFEGSQGGSEQVSAGPPIEPPPTGDVTVRGTIVSTELLGDLGIALLPAGFALPETSPCVPSNLRRYAQRGAFSINDAAPGEYMLVAYRFGPGYTSFQRTMRKITVGTTTTDAGIFTLPARVNAAAEEGGPGLAEDEGKVTWTAPPGFTIGFRTSAFDVTRETYLCSQGSRLTVLGNYEVPTSGIHDVKVVVESANKEQMSVQVIEAEND